MNNSDIVSHRVHNQRLESSTFTKPAEVLHWLGAMQAQDFHGAKWAVAQRMRAATNDVIERAFNEGAILRTHLMRPTWHFVAPDDIRWLLQLTAPRVKTSCASNYRNLELDPKILNRCNKVLTKALQGGKHLTRAVLKNVLNRAGVAADDSIRLGHILLHAELDAVVCSGPRAGNQFTYALFEERVPATRSLSNEEALAKLTRRYFFSHGPATLQDFVWWSGLTVAAAKEGISMVEYELAKASANNNVYWLPASDTRPNKAASAHLLPPYDEYLIAYKDRKAAVHNGPATDAGLFSSTIILGGKIVGDWKRTINKDSVTIMLKPVTGLNRRELQQIADAAQRYAAFLGLAAEIEFA